MNPLERLRRIAEVEFGDVVINEKALPSWQGYSHLLHASLDPIPFHYARRPPGPIGENLNPWPRGCHPSLVISRNLKDTIKARQLKHQPGLLLDPNQPVVARFAPKGLVTGNQSDQPATVDEGDVFEVDDDALNTLASQIPEKLAHLVRPVSGQRPTQFHITNIDGQFIQYRVHLPSLFR